MSSMSSAMAGSFFFSTSEPLALRTVPGTQEVLGKHYMKVINGGTYPSPHLFPSPTYQQLGEVGGLNVVIVDHGGDSSHERHPGWHVQVEMAGFGHSEMGGGEGLERERWGEREREQEKGNVDVLSTPNRAAQALG